MYATLAELKAYLGGTWGNDDDVILTQCIQAAQRLIETWTGRVFEASADETRTFSMRDVDGRTLWLADDLCAITSIVTNADGNEPITLSAADYVVRPRHATPYYAISLRASSDHAWTYQNDADSAIQVTGKWAYSTTPPDDVKMATLMLAAWLYRRRDSIGLDADRPLATGDGVVIMAADIPQLVRAVADRYRRRV